MDIHSDVSASSRYAKHIFQAVQKRKQKNINIIQIIRVTLFIHDFFLFQFAKCIICNVAFYDPTLLN